MCVDATWADRERLSNLMFERRVFRGVPFKLLKKQEAVDASASSILLREKLLRAQCASSHGPRAAQQQQQQTARSGLDSLKSAREPNGSAREREVGLQTDPHLVLLTSAAKETEAAAQTDKTSDRPASPLVALKAELVDADTQIQEGELFNFDEEVVPVLEVLVGRVIEQSLNEVIEEEELRAIRQQREAFERERLQQLIAVQALEAAEERRQQEAARRLAEEAAHQKLRSFAAHKAAAAACAGRLLWGLEQTILEEMLQSREFVKPLTPAVENVVWPVIQRDAIYQGWRAFAQAACRSQTNSRVIAGVVAAALAPSVAELEEIMAMRQRKAARHLEKKLQQVEAFDNLLARRKQEAEERRQMAAADSLEETRAWEQSTRDREQKENELLEAEDLNVLLLSRSAPEGDPIDPTDFQEGEEEGQEEAAEDQ
ncbi:hypothetical protein Esti_003438 [Eimeria stiedai]